MDDFVYYPGYRQLIKTADIVKLDLKHMSRYEVREHITLLRRPGIRLVAKKIETCEELEFGRVLEFDPYQSYVLGTPTTIVDGAADDVATGSDIEYLSTENASHSDGQ